CNPEVGLASLNGSTSGLIATLFTEGLAAGMTDEQLLERFAARDEPAAERAFATLVRRHGAMVLGVCRDSLGNRHDAEDAFQATSVCLGARGARLGEPGRLGPWLHGVARRTALKARGQRARRDRLAHRARAIAVAMRTEPKLDRHEEAAMLHDEIGRLPERYR